MKSETLPITSTKSAAVARFQEEDLEDVTFSVQQMKLSSVRGVQAALGYAPRGACFAIYSGAVPLHPSHRVLMSALSRGSAPPVVGSFITVKDLLHYWLHILYINSKEEDEGLKKVLILPELFHVDMDLFLNLVQITGLKPYLLAEVDTHVLEVDVAIEELEVTTNQLQRQIRQLVHGNASAAVLFDRVGGVYSVAPADAFATKVDAFATQVDDGGEDDVFHLELDQPMKSVDFHCDTCRERHRCNMMMTTEEDKLMFNELYPKDGFVIYLDPTSTNVIFCPYYPHIDYERIFLSSGKELETPTSEDNSPSVRLIKDCREGYLLCLSHFW